MVSNDAVFNQMLEVSAESLDFLSSEELYEWTTSYHGIPLSFSKIFEANLIEVSINPEGLELFHTFLIFVLIYFNFNLI